MRSLARNNGSRLTVAAIFASAICSASPSFAQLDVALDAIGLVETFTDVTVRFQTPLGVALPVRFHGDRSLSGNSGSIARQLGAETDRGRWWVADAHLCQKWNVWFDATTNCVRVFRSGSQITWKGPDGKSGRGTIVKRTMLTQKPKRRLPRPSALGAPVPKLDQLTSTPKERAIGRYSQPLHDNQQTYEISTAHRNKPILIVAYPSASSQVIGEVGSSTFQLPGWGACTNGWCPVVYHGQHGWMQQKYLKRGGGIASQGYVGGGLLYRVSNVRSWDVLNVRDQPTASSPIVGQLGFNERNIKLIGACRKLWCPVRLGGQRGWVNSHYLAIQ